MVCRGCEPVMPSEGLNRPLCAEISADGLADFLQVISCKGLESRVWGAKAGNPQWGAGGELIPEMNKQSSGSWAYS